MIIILRCDHLVIPRDSSIPGIELRTVGPFPECETVAQAIALGGPTVFSDYELSSFEASGGVEAGLMSTEGVSVSVTAIHFLHPIFG